MAKTVTADSTKEIERLFQLEFADVGEVGVRFIGSLIAASFIWLYVGWSSAWVWIGTYLVLMMVYFLFLRTKLDGARAVDVLLAQIIFATVLLSYLWMPILMISSSDDALAASGFCILFCIIIFTVRRAEKHSAVMVIEIASVSSCLCAGTVSILARYDNPLVWIGLVIAPTTVIFYLIQAATILRRQRLISIEIAARTSQAQKLEAIGKLAGGVAHDFNNLLTVILGNLDLIREVEDPMARDELLTEARTAALRGAKVVRQLLTYARQTDGTPRVIAASDLLRSVEALCRTLVPASISLKATLQSKEVFVCVDDALFVAALLNLIKNGVDAIEGPGEISVSAVSRHLVKSLHSATGQSLPAGHFVVFSVADTGHGISATDLDRVTDPFFTTKVVGKGSGLGLSMVAGFVMESGGSLEIQSGSKGTVVSILLPEVESDG